MHELEQSSRRWRRYLIYEVLVMVVRQRLRGTDDLVKVRVHEVINYVYIVEDGARRSREHILYGYDVVMVEVAQEAQLPQCALGVNGVVKRVWDLLDGQFLAGAEVSRRTAG